MWIHKSYKCVYDILYPYNHPLFNECTPNFPGRSAKDLAEELGSSDLIEMLDGQKVGSRQLWLGVKTHGLMVSCGWIKPYHKVNLGFWWIVLNIIVSTTNPRLSFSFGKPSSYAGIGHFEPCPESGHSNGKGSSRWNPFRYEYPDRYDVSSYRREICVLYIVFFHTCINMRLQLRVSYSRIDCRYQESSSGWPFLIQPVVQTHGNLV